MCYQSTTEGTEQAASQSLQPGEQSANLYAVVIVSGIILNFTSGERN